MDTAMIMNSEGFNDKVQAQLQEMENNPVISKLLEAAETIEQAYEIAKHYVDMTFDKFSQLYEEAKNFYQEAKMELSDDTMENIVGGRPKWLNMLRKIALATAIVAGVILACAFTAGVAGGAVAAAGAAATIAAGGTVEMGVIGATAIGCATGAVGGAIAGGVYTGKGIYQGSKGK